VAAATAESTLPLTGREFITTWSISERRKNPKPIGVFAQPGERFDLRTALGKRMRRKSRYVLSATLRSSIEQPALLKLGCSRRCVVRLDGEVIGELDVKYDAHIDDRIIPLHLTQGDHSIEVTVTPRTRRRRPQEVIVRLQSQSNQPLDGLRQVFGSEVDAARLMADRIPVHFTSRVEFSNLQLSARLDGGLPSEPRIQAELRAVNAVRTTSLMKGQGMLAVPIPNSKQKTTAVLTLRSEGRVLRRVQHQVRSLPIAVQAIERAQQALEKRTEAPRSLDAWDTVEYAKDHLLELLHQADSDTRWIEKRAGSLVRRTDVLLSGADPFEQETGLVIRAYRSSLDGRLQPYALYIPPSYDRSREWPMITALHPSGFKPLLALRLVMGKTKKGSKRSLTRHHPKYRDRGAFVVAPYGYRGTGSRYFGKVDVLEVMTRIRKRYRIADDRITLTGGSLGGLGSFHLGLRMPDRFNAIMPIAGYGSVKLYGDVMRKPRAAWEPFLIARRDNATFVPNARHLFMHCIHGALDSPRRSEVIVNRYRRRGYRHRYDLLEDVGHNAWDDGYEGGTAFRLNRRHRRPERPRRVTFVSGSYRHRSAYWLRIEQFDDHAALAQVDARISASEIRATTHNVRRLSLELQGEVPLLDGQRLAAGTGWVTFAKEGKQWIKQDTAEPPSVEKRPGISGPMDDVLYDPHVFVYGTQDITQTDTNRRRAKEAARYYWNSAEIHVPVVADYELTQSQRRRLHLVLIGNPASNSVFAEIQNALPIKFVRGGIEFKGKRFEGPSLGTSFVYPNPMTQGRTYVKVHAGVRSRGTWLSGYLPRWGPDYLIYDEGIAVQRFGRLMDRRRPLAGGYFDRRWN
jgi:hypothetical protein